MTGQYVTSMQPGMVPQPVMEQQPGYDEDTRTTVPPYYITREFNFIDGASYDQVVICEIGSQLSYTDAMNKAAQLAQERNAFGFFYQMHNNGHQIVGFC
jgi:hypothetical protein